MRGEKHTVNGELLTRSEAAKAYGWSKTIISERMKKGMSLEDAANVDRNPPPKTEKVCPQCNIEKPIAEYNFHSGRSGKRQSYCKPCGRRLQREWRGKHKERDATQMRDYKLRKKYGINSKQYEDMLKQQEGVCLGCGGECATGNRLAVDHCHETGKVRGLLCVLCNRAVGASKDNPATLRRLADYLEGVDGRPTANYRPRQATVKQEEKQFSG